MMLEIVTRHILGRPTMLAANMDSIRRMVYPADVEVKQTLLIDDVGRGMAWAQTQLAGFEPIGDYVWLLDDDDRAICPHLAECIRDEAMQATDAVFVRVNHKAPLGILPKPAYWGRAPEEGQIGGTSVIATRALWQQCRGAWASGRYEADADFVKAVYEAADRISWHDCVAAECQRPQSMGAPE